MYENVIPSPVENATVQKYINDTTGAHISYFVTPNEGYVLHDKFRDWEDIDPITGEPSTYHLGYTRGTATCAPNYDFEANPREFYAVLASSVPADQIFGGGDNPEIM